MKNLTHIVPCLPPAIDGVGDYNAKLWEHWLEPQQWRFLVTTGASLSQQQWQEVKIADFDKSKVGLVSALGATATQTAILHYVGYGFHPKGCPVWLPQALKEWKAISTHRQVVVMFHETYATEPFWRTSFWLQPVARKIVRDLILLADLWLTSCWRYHRQLVNNFAAESSKGAMIPIGTNISPAEPINFDRPWSLFKGEKLKVVIFGLSKTRLWALNVHAKFLKALCARDWVESITLAGISATDAKTARQMARHRADIGHAELWREAFDLTSSQVSQLLATQDLGLVSNEPNVLSKSGVFAALSSHGAIAAICGQAGQMQASWEQSVFLYDSDSMEQCLQQMLNRQEIERKKQALRSLVQTNLDWKKIALAWVEHLKQIE